MRLDRVNLRAVSDILRAMVKEAMMEPGKVVRMALPTSPSDGVQIFVVFKGDGDRFMLAIRRPKGSEDPREMEALARHMGLRINKGPYPEKGRLVRPGWTGRRTYLVAECVKENEALAQ